MVGTARGRRHYTKAQARRALQAVGAKAFRLFESGWIQQNDLVEFAKITERALKRMERK